MSAEVHAVCQLGSFGEVVARLDAPPWPQLASHPLRETVTGGAPQQATTMKFGWTPNEWRVLFHCEDTHIWATHTRRDAPLYEEEVVEVFVDPVGDLAAYFEIELNPLNTVMDLVLRRNRSGWKKDFAWQCDGLRTTVTRTATAWTAELAIPFASLAAEPPRAGSVWHANFFRIDRPAGQPRELSAWSPTHLGTFHAAERFGAVEFVA